MMVVLDNDNSNDCSAIDGKSGGDRVVLSYWDGGNHQKQNRIISLITLLLMVNDNPSVDGNVDNDIHVGSIRILI